MGMLTAPGTVHGQIRASELGTVSQVVDGTKVTIEYSRPRARGRNPLFGTRIVQWNEVWTPGANYATTFNTSKDVQLNGARVPKGIYSVWLVVRQAGDWTMVLDPRARMFHEDHPDSTAQQIRFPVHVDQVTPPLEVLTWTFNDIRPSGATIAMQWGTYRVTAFLVVEPTLSKSLAATVASDYVGKFSGKGTGLSYSNTDPFTLNVTYDDGVLHGEFDPEDKYLKRFALMRVAGDIFTVGIYDGNGQIYEVLRPDMMITFTRTNGRVTGFEIRDEQDRLDATGSRARP